MHKFIWFVFQNFNLIDELTVEENIDLQLKYLGIGKAERKERVLEILRKVNLTVSGQSRKAYVERGALFTGWAASRAFGVLWVCRFLW